MRDWRRELTLKLEKTIADKLEKVFDGKIYDVAYYNVVLNYEDWLSVSNVASWIAKDVTDTITLALRGEYEGCIQIYDDDIATVVETIVRKYNIPRNIFCWSID